jgi:hypothetical protein
VVTDQTGDITDRYFYPKPDTVEKSLHKYISQDPLKTLLNELENKE